MRFTLEPRRWYACQLIGDEFIGQPHRYSPIRVESVTPRKTGSRTLDLAFYHANYPEGVRYKTYTLQTLERGKLYLLARSTTHETVRIMLIHSIDWDWLEAHFDIRREEGVSVDDRLNCNL